LFAEIEFSVGTVKERCRVLSIPEIRKAAIGLFGMQAASDAERNDIIDESLGSEEYRKKYGLHISAPANRTMVVMPERFPEPVR